MTGVFKSLSLVSLASIFWTVFRAGSAPIFNVPEALVV